MSSIGIIKSKKMSSSGRKRENKEPTEEKPKQLLYFVIDKNMEMLMDIWSIRSLNESIYDTNEWCPPAHMKHQERFKDSVL